MALIGWWPLDGNTNDYSVNGNNGVPTSITYANGKIGQAASFNEANSIITTNVSLLNNIGSYTFALWAYVTSTTFQSLMGQDDLIEFGIYTTNNLYLWQGGRTVDWVWDTVNYPLNNWYHITVVARLGSPFTLYINGQQVATGSNVIAATTSVRPFNIGNQTFSTGTQRWGGLLNDVRVYNHALSKKEINELVKAKVLHYTFNKDDGAVVYNSTGLKKNGTVLGATWTNEGYDFISGNINSTIISNTQQTVSFFVRPSSSGIREIISGSPGGASRFEIFQSGYKIVIRGNSVTAVTQNSTLNNLKFWHIAVVYNGTQVKLYVDGVLDITGTITSVPNSIGTLSIGSYLNGEFPFVGKLDNIQIYTTALSDADILDLYKTKAKLDNQGNLYANEFVEDYEVVSGLTLKQLFEDNNLIINGGFENGTTGWFFGNGFNVTSEKSLRGRISAKLTNRLNYAIQDISITNGNKVYIVGNIFNVNLPSSLALLNTSTIGTYNNQQNSSTSLMDEWVPLSLIRTIDGGGVRVIAGIFGSNSASLAYYDEYRAINLSELVTQGYFSVEPTKSQMDAWYRDYMNSRMKQNGQVITKEFNEVGIDTIAVNGLTYRQIFETNNDVVNPTMLDANSDGLADGWSFSSTDVNTTYSNNGIQTWKNPTYSGYNGAIRSTNFTYTPSNTDIYYLTFYATNTGSVAVKAEYLRNNAGGASLTGQNWNGTYSYKVNTFGSLTNHNNIRFYALNVNNDSTLDNVYFINMTSLGISGLTVSQMDELYIKYKQLKIVEQKMKIAKDSINILGSLNEGGQ
jgi:hypothetical protein